MNPRSALYLSGASMLSGYAYPRGGGRRVPVLDPDRRPRAAVMACLRAGMTPRQAARALRIPLGRVVALGLAALRREGRI